MKKFLQEFKEFAMRGNVVDMAVGVVIGAAFGKVVSSVVEIFINPIVTTITEKAQAAATAAAAEGAAAAGLGGTAIITSLVSFLGVVVEFILTALVLFLIIKGMNAAKNLKKKDEKPAAPTTKECPFCFSEINIKATRCPHCAAELKKAQQ